MPVRQLRRGEGWKRQASIRYQRGGGGKKGGGEGGAEREHLLQSFWPTEAGDWLWERRASRTQRGSSEDAPLSWEWTHSLGVCMENWAFTSCSLGTGTLCQIIWPTGDIYCRSDSELVESCTQLQPWTTCAGVSRTAPSSPTYRMDTWQTSRGLTPLRLLQPPQPSLLLLGLLPPLPPQIQRGKHSQLNPVGQGSSAPSPM